MHNIRTAYEGWKYISLYVLSDFFYFLHFFLVCTINDCQEWCSKTVLAAPGEPIFFSFPLWCRGLKVPIKFSVHEREYQGTAKLLLYVTKIFGSWVLLSPAITFFSSFFHTFFLSHLIFWVSYVKMNQEDFLNHQFIFFPIFSQSNI